MKVRKPKDLVINHQDTFIQQIINSQNLVSIYMRNGIRLTGCILCFDDSSFLLKDNGIQLVYIEAVSTILPG